MLDHMGTMDIWLNFIYQAYDERSVDASIEFYSGEEYEKYLKESRRKLNYDISKRYLMIEQNLFMNLSED